MPNWFNAFFEPPEIVRYKAKEFNKYMQADLNDSVPFAMGKGLLGGLAEGAAEQITPANFLGAAVGGTNLGAFGNIAGKGAAAIRNAGALKNVPFEATPLVNNIKRGYGQIEEPFNFVKQAVKNIRRLPQIPAIETAKQLIDQGVPFEEAILAASKGYKRLPESGINNTGSMASNLMGLLKNYRGR